MALNNSPSPISLGGSTTGQSVNLELGQSATATISFNDANVRTLTGTSASTSLSMPAGFWGKSSATPISSYIYDSTGTNIIQTASSALCSGSNNLYLAGSDTNGGYVVKLDSAGNIIWQKTYLGTSFLNIGKYSTYYVNSNNAKLAVDASENLYFIAQNNSGPGATGQTILVKVSGSDGSVLWSKTYTFASGSGGNAYGTGVQLDSSGNVILVYTANTSAVIAPTIHKYDPSGNLLLTTSLTTFSGSRTDWSAYSFILDSSDNIYLCGRGGDTPATAAINAGVVKISSSGIVLWTSSFTSSATGVWRCTMYDIAINSAGNLITCGQIQNYTTGIIYGGVFELNPSTGAVVRQRLDTITNGAYYGITSDTSGNVYVFGRKNYSPVSFNLIKLSSDISTTPTWINSLVPQTPTNYDNFVGFRPASIFFNKGLLNIISDRAITGASSGAGSKQGGVLMQLSSSGTGLGNKVFANINANCYDVYATDTVTATTTPLTTSSPTSLVGSTGVVIGTMTITTTTPTYSNQVRNQ